MKPFLLSGSLAGLVIVIGEALLNGVFLKSNWDLVNSQLGLVAPSSWVVSLAMTKLFILGFVLVWLYEIFSHKYGAGIKAAMYVGLTIGLLIWGWVLMGMWLAGYVDNTIAVATFFWGLVELPLATIVGAKAYSKMSPK